MEEIGTTKEIGINNRPFECIKNLSNIHGYDYSLWFGECVPDVKKHYIYIECDKSPIGVWTFSDTEKEKSIKIIEDAIARFNLKALIDNIDKNLDVIL